MFSPGFVCLSVCPVVCLFVYEQDSSKNFDEILRICLKR